jgi:hypothetical protein
MNLKMTKNNLRIQTVFIKFYPTLINKRSGNRRCKEEEKEEKEERKWSICYTTRCTSISI